MSGHLHLLDDLLLPRPALAQLLAAFVEPLQGRLQVGDALLALNKSILDFSAPASGKAWFSAGSHNEQLIATDFGSASLRCGKRRILQRAPIGKVLHLCGALAAAC
ncbi:MAG TPA: hypothetical protein VHN38_00010 [Immundisolibacter sp.]|nr:hypothetical protein [Immundisolibacter sp.]